MLLYLSFWRLNIFCKNFIHDPLLLFWGCFSVYSVVLEYLFTSDCLDRQVDLYSVVTFPFFPFVEHLSNLFFAPLTRLKCLLNAPPWLFPSFSTSLNFARSHSSLGFFWLRSLVEFGILWVFYTLVLNFHFHLNQSHMLCKLCAIVQS